MTSVPRQLSPAKAWCFTLNNWTENEYEFLSSAFLTAGMKYIIGKEIGEQGTPHLQGYMHSSDGKKFRPLPKYACNRLNNQGDMKNAVHWERAKGTKDQNYTYCAKDRDFVTNMEAPPPPPPTLEELEAIWNEPIDYSKDEDEINTAQARREEAAKQLLYLLDGTIDLGP